MVGEWYKIHGAMGIDIQKNMIKYINGYVNDNVRMLSIK